MASIIPATSEGEAQAVAQSPSADGKPGDNFLASLHRKEHLFKDLWPVYEHFC